MKFFDLRLPLGWLFAVLGFVLVIAGLSGNGGSAAAAVPSTSAGGRWLGINVVWGGVMICFGLLCLWLARREARRRERSNHRL